MRASDADRDHVADVLRDALAEGRLTAQEHAERLDAVYAAKTHGELAPITQDLPVSLHSPPPTSPSTTRSRAPLQPVSEEPIVAVFSEVKRKGRWTVPATTTATAVFGKVELDLREAVLVQREVTIVANSFFGAVEFKVPEGVHVRDSGIALFGNRAADQSGAQDPNAPVIHVRGFTLFGATEIKRGWLRRTRGPNGG